MKSVMRLLQQFLQSKHQKHVCSKADLSLKNKELLHNKTYLTFLVAIQEIQCSRLERTVAGKVQSHFSSQKRSKRRQNMLKDACKMK